MDQTISERDAGYVVHPAGTLSRTGVIDVGLKCMHSCQHCFYSHLDGTDDQFAGMRKAKFHTDEALLTQVDGLFRNGFMAFDVTGGEPCLHSGLEDMVAYATKRGIASRIITLGQYLMRPMFKRDGLLLDRLLDAGVTDFRFSMHAVDEALFRAMTGESWARQLAAMDHLDARGFQYVTNTTITELNFKHLPDVAREIVKHQVYQTSWLLFMPYYQWNEKDRSSRVQARFSEVRPYLKEAIDIVEAAGIGATLRYAPICTMHGMEKNNVGVLGVRYDPHEWMNTIDHYGKRDPSTYGAKIAMPNGQDPGLGLFDISALLGDTTLIAARGNQATRSASKVFPVQCSGCARMNVCDGVDPSYIKHHGAGELVPYQGEQRGGILDKDRVTYVAGHVLKLKPWADVRSVVRAALGR